MAGELSHFLKELFQAAVVSDGLLKEFGLAGGEAAGDGLALFFPGPLVIGAVGFLFSGAAGVGPAEAEFGDGALEEEPGPGQAAGQPLVALPLFGPGGLWFRSRHFLLAL